MKQQIKRIANKQTTGRAIEILSQRGVYISRQAIHNYLNNQSAGSRYEKEIIAAYQQAAADILLDIETEIQSKQKIAANLRAAVMQ